MLKNFFRWLSRNVIPDNEKIHENLIYPYPLRRGIVKVNATIEIPTSHTLIVVIKGRVTDVLSAGRHKVNGSTMPVSFKKMDMGKASKHGNYRNRFKAQLYYVNLKTFANFKFSSGSAFHLRSEQFGRVKGYTEGFCDLHVVNAEEFIKYLLKYVSKIKPKFVKEEAERIVGNVASKIMEKNKIEFSNVLLKPEILEPFFESSMNSYLEDYGLSVDGAQLSSVRLAKKVQKKVNDFLSSGITFTGELGNVLNVSNADGKQLNENESSQMSYSEVSSEKVNKAQVSQNEESLSFSNSSKSSQPNTGYVNRRMQNVELTDNLNEGGGLIIPSLNASDILTSDENSLKQCKYCGTNIELKHKYCPKCGFKQHD